MKKSSFIQRMQEQKAYEIQKHRAFTIQWCADAAIMAANEVFQRKGEKLVEFNNTFAQYAKMIAEMTLDDARGDKSIVYTKEKVDGRLKELLGDAFVPWDDRYKF